MAGGALLGEQCGAAFGRRTVGGAAGVGEDVLHQILDLRTAELARGQIGLHRRTHPRVGILLVADAVADGGADRLETAAPDPHGRRRGREAARPPLAARAMAAGAGGAERRPPAGEGEGAQLRIGSDRRRLHLSDAGEDRRLRGACRLHLRRQGAARRSSR